MTTQTDRIDALVLARDLADKSARIAFEIVDTEERQHLVIHINPGDVMLKLYSDGTWESL